MSTSSDKPILIIEDDIDISELIRIHLSDLNFGIEQSHDGTEALKLALKMNIRC